MEPVPLTADDPAPSVKDSGGTVIKLRDRVEDTSVCKFGLGTVVGFDRVNGGGFNALVDWDGGGAARDQMGEGLKVADKPTLLDASLVGLLVFMRWPAPHGWLVGVVTEKFTNATPRLFAKFNYRIKWFDGWQNHNLLLDNYLHGPDAPYNSCLGPAGEDDC